ncbi:MAG: hypothetical protein E7617_08070 [Ruminococcaceae bacterium]|nr:hypothetical protein [Oscillospiraceae bacterium]
MIKEYFMESYINIDKNMIAAETIGDREVVWYNVEQAPFSIHGLIKGEGDEYFHRVPDAVAEATNPGVHKLARESAGGRVRFSTDSPYIAVRARFRVVGRSVHIPLIANAGFDLYVDGEFGSRYIKEFRMVIDMTDRYEQLIDLEGSALRSYTVNFPIHSVVEMLEIGLKPGSALGAPRPYRDIAPMTVYGSSIVHGTGSSHPGAAYPSIISRDLNIDYRNMGFSGVARGEAAIAEWLAQQPTSVFVCDYDHNAPNAEHLMKTHYRFYEIIREKNPELPYIMITRPNYWTCVAQREEILDRRDVIMRSYLRARENGDRNVYFIDGMSLHTGPRQYESTIDGVHPNDLGFVRMAESIGALVRHILEKKNEGI